MVIRKEDRVSAVLKANASLIDVFTALSPAFERLRNPGMRKVMARLVTVEQAARMAGVDADELVARLNTGARTGQDARTTGGPDGPAGDGPAGDGSAGDASSGHTPGGSFGDGPAVVRPEDTSPDPALPSALAAIPPASVLELDVREDLRSGREPFSRIMGALREVPPGGALCLRALFEPVPLYAVMAKQGLAHHTERLGPDDWRVWFYGSEADAVAGSPPAAGGPAPGVSEGAPPAGRHPAAGPDRPDPSAAGEGSGSADDVVILDVRGLEPPEPMVRTLAALESLPSGGTLVQINARVPQFLLPRLEERGFTYEVREQEPGLVRLFIRRS